MVEGAECGPHRRRVRRLMAVRSPGLLTLDGVDFRILQEKDGGLAWTEHTRSSLPGQSTPEEAILATKPPSHTRTLGFLDWSHGIGASVYRPGDPRMHWSEGPSGALPQSIHRGHETRAVSLEGVAEVTDFFEVANKLYVVNGGYIRQVTPTLNAETVAAARPDGLVNGDGTGVFISGTVFTEASPLWADGTSDKVFLGSEASFLISFDGTAWAQSADVKRSRFTVGKYTDGLRLWGSEPTLNIRNLPQAQDPNVEANWSGNLPVTNKTAACTGLVALRDSVVVAYDNGTAYRFSSVDGLASPLIGPEAALPYKDAGRGMCIWNGILLVPTARGLMALQEQTNDQGSFVTVGPEHLTGNRSPVKGPPTALCASDPEWLYAAFHDGTDAYVYQARRPVEGEGARVRLIWQAVAKLDDTKVTALHISNLGTNPLLCIGTDTPSAVFVTLPRAGETVHTDANCRSRITPHSVYLSDHDALTPTIQETFWRGRASTREMSTAETVTVLLRYDGGDWEEVGEITESPYAEIILPTPTSGRSVGVQLRFAGTDNTVFPELLSFEIDYLSDGETATWIDAQVFVAQHDLLPSGLNRLGVTDRLEFLRNLVRPDATPVEAVGPLGTTHTVKLDRTAGIVAKAVLHHNGVQEPGYVVAFRLNLYDDLIAHDPAVYDVSPYSTGTIRSYYG